MPDYEPPKQPSKMPEYVRAYHRQHYATISANVPRPFKDQFRRACQNAGKSVHAVLIELAAEYVAVHAGDAPGKR